MRHFTLTAVFVVAVFYAQSAFAQWPAMSGDVKTTPRPDDVALVVSVEDYAFLPDIRGVSQSANDWETYFRKSLKTSRVLTLRDRDATREQVIDFADRALSLATPESRVWFVFIGHGATTTSGDAVLVGVDGQNAFDSIDARGIRRDEIAKKLGSGNHAETVMVLDACFSGKTSSGEPLIQDAQPIIPTSTAVAKNVVMLTAASADEVAGPGYGIDRPAFSYLILGALRGWADDGDGTVTASEAVAFAKEKLLAIPGRKQTPEVIGAGYFALATGASESFPEQRNPTSTLTVRQDTPRQSFDPPLFARAFGGFGFVDSSKAANEARREGRQEAAQESGMIYVEPDPIKASVTSVLLRGDFGFKHDISEKFDVRYGVAFNYFRGINPISSAEEAELSEIGQELGIDLDTELPLRNRHLLSAMAGPSLGYAINDEPGQSKDMRLVFGVEGGVNGRISKVCTRYSTNENNDFSCATSTDEVDPIGAVGGHVAFQWNFLTIGLFTNYGVGDNTFTGAIMTGLVFDP